MRARTRDPRAASSWHTPTCPNGCKATLTEERRNRVHVTYACDACGQGFMVDRATGRMIARTSSID